MSPYAQNKTCSNCVPSLWNIFRNLLLLCLFLKVLKKTLLFKFLARSIKMSAWVSNFLFQTFCRRFYFHFSCTHTYFGSIWWSSSSVFFFSSINCSVRSSTTASRLLAYFSMIDIMLSKMFGFLQINKKHILKERDIILSPLRDQILIVWLMDHCGEVNYLSFAASSKMQKK